MSPDRSLAEPAPAKVFISYSRKDLAFADRLGAELKASGFEPLIDRSDIYVFEDWWKRIQELIAKADTIVFVISPDSVASDICQKEVAYAAELNKRIAPVLVRSTEDKAIPEGLARLNFLFFTEPGQFDTSLAQLAQALATDIGWIRRHTELGEQARRWQASGRRSGLLLRSPVLEEAEQWIASRPGNAPAPTEETQSFIAQSRRAATRRRNTLTGSLAASLVLALALAGLAYWQRGIAVEQERIAERERKVAVEQRDRALLTQSRFLADLAQQRLQANDAGTAMLFALEALPDKTAGIERPYAREAEQALFVAAQGAYESMIIPGGDASLDPTRSRVLVSGSTVKIYDLKDGRPLVEFADHPDSGSYVAQFSPDGKRVVTVDRNDVVRIADAETGLPLARFPAVATNLKPEFPFAPEMHFSRDGGRLIVRLWDGSVAVWDVNTGKQLTRLPESEGPMSHASLSPDGRYFVTTAPFVFSLTDDRDIVKIWNADTGKLVRTLPTKDYDVKFNPDGQLATQAGAAPQLWDVQTGRIVHTLEGHSAKVTALQFSRDGRRVLTASEDKTARLWDTRTGKTIAMMSGHAAAVKSAEFILDERRVVTWSDDGSAPRRRESSVEEESTRRVVD